MCRTRYPGSEVPKSVQAKTAVSRIYRDSDAGYEHVKRVEEKYIEADRTVDVTIDQLLITIGGESLSVTQSVTGMEAAKTNGIIHIFLN